MELNFTYLSRTNHLNKLSKIDLPLAYSHLKLLYNLLNLFPLKIMFFQSIQYLLQPDNTSFLFVEVLESKIQVDPG